MDRFAGALRRITPLLAVAGFLLTATNWYFDVQSRRESGKQPKFEVVFVRPAPKAIQPDRPIRKVFTVRNVGEVAAHDLEITITLAGHETDIAIELDSAGEAAWVVDRRAGATQAVVALGQLSPKETFRIALVFRAVSGGAAGGMTLPELAEWAHLSIDTREGAQRTCSSQHPPRSRLGFDAIDTDRQ
jgi:hypothetical protein